MHINCMVETWLHELATMSSIVLCSLGNNNANNNDTNNNNEEEVFPIPTIYRYVSHFISVAAFLLTTGNLLSKVVPVFVSQIIDIFKILTTDCMSVHILIRMTYGGVEV